MKCCIIVANTYWGMASYRCCCHCFLVDWRGLLRRPRPHAQLMTPRACVGVPAFMPVCPTRHHAPAAKPCACAKALPVAWRLYVGVARPLPAFQKQATASQGRQRWYCYQRWRLPRLDMHKQHLVNCVWHCKYIVNSSVLLVNNNWMYLLFILQTSHIFGLARLLLCYALCTFIHMCVSDGLLYLASLAQ